MKTLDLVLKRKWYDMIASGEKTEEYREIKPYWESRLGDCFRWCSRTLNNDGLHLNLNSCKICSKNLNQIAYASNRYDAVTFHLGYSKDRPSMTFAIKEIVIDEGKEEWGALPGEIYFVIKLGERL